nr:unnamed protein product [Spirometra erinaceieuropaei]
MGRNLRASFTSPHLFTSIPQDLAIETIELLLREKYDETENRLRHAQIIQLLKFCLKTYFTFDGTIYEQVKGAPMGSPVSGLIAEAVLQRLESLVFRQNRPKFWARIFSRPLDMGPQRLFPSAFLVVYIPCAIIDADLLAAFSLLVDCCRFRSHDKTIDPTVRDIHHIDGLRNEVANALPRPSIAHLQLSPGIDQAKTAAEQRSIGSPWEEGVPGLQIQDLLLITDNSTILCDVSTIAHSLYFPTSLQSKVFSSLHNLSSQPGSYRQASFRPHRLAWDLQGP